MSIQEKQVAIDARIDIINNLDPRDGSIKDQQDIAKNLPLLSKHFDLFMYNDEDTFFEED
jgi:hypothetical protein